MKRQTFPLFIACMLLSLILTFIVTNGLLRKRPLQTFSKAKQNIGNVQSDIAGFFLHRQKKQNNLLVSVSVSSCVLVSKLIFLFTLWKQWRKEGSFTHSAKIFIEIRIHHNGCADNIDSFQN